MMTDELVKYMLIVGRLMDNNVFGQPVNVLQHTNFNHLCKTGICYLMY